MSVTDKMWDATTTVIKMNDRVERLAGSVKAQQEKIENLTARVVRLETALEIALASEGLRKKRLDVKSTQKTEVIHRQM